MIERLMQIESNEPTISDVLEIVQKGFVYMEERFDRTDQRINNFESQVNRRLDILQDRIDNFDARLQVVERKTTHLENMVADLQEDFAAFSVAFDKDSEKLVELENRAEKLEEVIQVA